MRARDSEERWQSMACGMGWIMGGWVGGSSRYGALETVNHMV